MIIVGRSSERRPYERRPRYFGASVLFAFAAALLYEALH